MVNNIDDLAEAYNLMYVKHGGEVDCVMHTFFLKGRGLFGANPVLSLLEDPEGSHYSILQGTDQKFPMHQMGETIKDWCKLIGLKGRDTQ